MSSMYYPVPHTGGATADFGYVLYRTPYRKWESLLRYDTTTYSGIPPLRNNRYVPSQCVTSVPLRYAASVQLPNTDDFRTTLQNISAHCVTSDSYIVHDWHYHKIGYNPFFLTFLFAL